MDQTSVNVICKFLNENNPELNATFSVAPHLIDLKRSITNPQSYLYFFQANG